MEAAMGALRRWRARFAPGARVRVRRATRRAMCARPGTAAAARRDRTHLRQLRQSGRACLQSRRLAGTAALSRALPAASCGGTTRATPATRSRSRFFSIGWSPHERNRTSRTSRGYYRRMQSAIEELLILKGVFTARRRRARGRGNGAAAPRSAARNGGARLGRSGLQGARARRMARPRPRNSASPWGRCA